MAFFLLMWDILNNMYTNRKILLPVWSELISKNQWFLSSLMLQVKDDGQCNKNCKVSRLCCHEVLHCRWNLPLGKADGQECVSIALKDRCECGQQNGQH